MRKFKDFFQKRLKGRLKTADGYSIIPFPGGIRKDVPENESKKTSDGYQIIPSLTNTRIDEQAESEQPDMVASVGKIHPKDVEDINQYTRSSKLLNAALITIGKPTEDKDAIIHQTLHRNMNTIKHPITLFTGVNHFDPEQLANTSKDGIIHSAAHLSTTTKKRTAESFSSYHNGYNHIMAIHAEPGAKMLHVSHISSFPEESETILPSGTRLKYTHTDINGWVKIHHFKIHSQIEPSSTKNAHQRIGNNVNSEDIRHVFNEKHDSSPASGLYEYVRNSILKHPSVTGHDLDHIYNTHPQYSYIHDQIVTHPKLPEHIMQKYIEDYPSKASTLLQNPSVPSHMVQHIFDASKPNEHRREIALAHPNIPKDTFDRAYYDKHTSPSTLQHVLETSPNITPKHLEYALNHHSDNYDVLTQALQHPKMTPELLDKFHDHRNGAVLVALHPNTSTETLSKLMNSSDNFVRDRALKHLNIDVKHLIDNAHDKDKTRIIATHPKLPSHILDEFIRSGDERKIKPALENPNITAEHITHLVTNPDVSTEIKQHALFHPLANSNHLEIAAADPSLYMKRSVVSHPNTNKGTLQRIANENLNLVKDSPLANHIHNTAIKRLKYLDHGVEVYNPLKKDII